MYGPAKKLSRVNANLQQAMAATDRIFEVLDTHSEVTDRPDAVPMSGLRYGLEFRDVRFTFPDAEQPTLNGVTFEVPVGQTRGAGGPQRCRQDHADEPAGAVLRPHRRRRPARRARHPRSDAGVAARAPRHGHAGDRALRRHRGRQHRLRQARRHARARSRRRRAPRTPTSSSPGWTQRLRHADRRARAAALRRAAPAPGDRARAAAGRADPDPRRGDVVARRRVRDAGAGRAGDV